MDPAIPEARTTSSAIPKANPQSAHQSIHLLDRVTQLASALTSEALKIQTRRERNDAHQLARMMNDPGGKAFTIALVDQVFRSRDRSTQAHRFRGILQRLGVPHYLSPRDRILLRAAAIASRPFPRPVMAAVENQLRTQSSRVVLSAETKTLEKYLKKRASAGIHVNLNHLGEAVLGERKAEQQLNAVLAHLANPLVRCVSVKISAIFSQINLLDWEGTLTAIKDRLRPLYRAAMPAQKLVYLDMEEYRDLHMTIAAFTGVLNEPEFRKCHAGMALQAYLPDSWQAQQDLTDWAKKRVNAGGAPIRLRLVKGANLAMERVEAELHGWNAAPYATKAETDANYRRMLQFGAQPENARAVHLGVASHNIFDVALALTLRDDAKLQNEIEIEMLEGMANHQARTVRSRGGDLLLYAPSVRRADFFSALAYLVRRLDENTGRENFLRDMFRMNVGSDAWENQRARFIAGWRSRSAVSTQSNRAAPKAIEDDSRFHNTADTDWTQNTNRQRLDQSLNCFKSPALPPLLDLNQMLDIAIAAQKAWEARGWGARAAILRSCAKSMERGRFETIVQMMHEGKKAIWEADPEVSEAIDFANYYAATSPPPSTVSAHALGIVVVTPPWNFPFSIPASGVLAALMAGNSVILKPAPETVQIAYMLASQLWDAGVPRDVLHFFPCADGPLGEALIRDRRVSAIVLTGAYETARTFLKWRPSLRLLAETSGKNAIIITAQADRDLAIKDLIKSAFGHSGQKCSAASLAILHHEVYDDPAFRDALIDAAASLHVGPSQNRASIITPLIRPPSPALMRALTTLDDGEQWLLQPRVDPHDPSLWSCGIKIGVKPGSWFHQTECFGPVLGLMRAENLHQAIDFQNSTPFGLTGGIHSLDENEIDFWRSHVQVGNAYINRSTTGAVVQRQPFGGWKKSSMGPGAKAGGPNYVNLFLDYRDGKKCDPAESYRRAWRNRFSIESDPTGLRCESNIQCYHAARGVILRTSDPEAIRRAKDIAHITGVPLQISRPEDETESALINRLSQIAPHAEFLRTTETPSDELLSAAYDSNLNWINAPIVAEGEIELPRWLREQSISKTRHRYGLIPEAQPPPPAPNR